MSLTIWCNAALSAPAEQRLAAGLDGHRLVFAKKRAASVLVAGPADAALAEADIVFGQPLAEDCLRFPRLRWVALTTAGYGRYDTPEFLETFRGRGAALTTSSSVFAEPCAQHVLAMMLALGRQLLASHAEQLGEKRWQFFERRSTSVLLNGQTVLLLGYGAIARRLVELLAPFGMKLYAVRRKTHSERGVHIIPEEKVSAVLGDADHIVNLLPDNEGTRNYVNARRLAACKPGARFYNIGRGTTVDERALVQSLENGRLGAAYLDVFAEEPLPPSSPLWTAPNCFITPHTAGGRHDQDVALVRHFLANLVAFERREPLADRVG
ncbi:MAG: D-2-hydroxyacid dehydrogenase [Verrucomicrobia bacterium]|nr:D-2-hydroxyacid dehydrogenase [Verrucomicrobiota bacterium]